jgi:hypothetical protein
MSDQLRIAGALRKLTDAQLIALARLRSVNTTNLRDFFDYAEALASEKSIRAALATLPAASLAPLWNATASSSIGKLAEHPEIANLLLVEPDSGKVFDVVEKVVSEMPISKPESVSIQTSEKTVEDIDRDARMHIFELIQAITEVVLDLEQRYIREVGKRSIGLPEVKRLASHLNQDVAYAKRVFELCLLTSIATIENSRWQLGDKAQFWLTANDQDRWQYLAECWVEQANPRALFDSKAAKSADNALTVMPAGEFFYQRFALVYWQQLPETQSHIDFISQLAETIGLTSELAATSWFNTLITKGVSAAAKQMAEGLPQTDRRLIVQADLSLIAPNPLATELEVELRTFAETEKIGLASSYRLSALSVSNGLECGMSMSRIRGLLEELSGKALPQPVEYLLTDAERKFGKIAVQADNKLGFSLVLSDDKVTLAQLYNDIKLKPLSLHYDEAGRLVSRFETEVLYYALRDAGYAAVRVDGDGKVISPKTIATPQQHVDDTSRIASDIARIREADTKIGTEPDDDDLLRQLQLAIKLKSKISVVLDLGGGKQVTYLIEPVGLANGRLRAKDRKADVERTLPISSIVSIELL